ncbi:MAG: cyclic nucleotide-binding domain-containing protein [Rhodobiaceae bacterium]|jgi:CRP-like cAMP-binding protein
MVRLFITPERGIRQTMFERDKYIIWEAGEVIYRAGDPSNEAFLIMEGSVQIFTSEGLLLNRIGTNEILGETSLLLNVSRTVTAITASTGAKATRIPRQYFEDIAARDRVTGALIRKSQYRLIDSNTQSNMLGTEIERLSVLVENAINNGFSDNTAIDELRTTIARLRKQVVFDKHHAYHPSTMEGSRDDGENADNFG